MAADLPDRAGGTHPALGFEWIHLAAREQVDEGGADVRGFWALTRAAVP